MSETSFDPKPAHTFFSAYCFNSAWEWIDKAERTEEESLALVDVAHASLWHWRQRDDCSAKNLSVGYWLLSRVHAILEDAAPSRRYGELSLKFALRDRNDAFTIGFAHEAIARAEMIAGNETAMDRHLDEAAAYAEKVKDDSDAAWLKHNLDDIFLSEE